jgi:hypothetical protein
MSKKASYYQALPGTHRQRSRARNLLVCTENSNDSWIVSGGENEHLVIRRYGVFLCDCYASEKEKKLCSHIIKVQMTLGQFPTAPILVTK